MTGLRVYTSLDMRSLAGQLVESIRERQASSGASGPNPFARDFIIADGKGTTNWLTHALVRGVSGQPGLGVHMNAELMNSRRFGPWLAGLLEGRGPADPVEDPLAGMEGTIYSILDDDASWAQWAGDPEVDQGVVKWGLCIRLAKSFRELIRNDSQWVIRAEGGSGREPDQWSALFYRTMVKLREPRTDANETAVRPGRRFLHEVDVHRALSSSNPASLDLVAKNLPSGLALFSTGDVAATHLEILRALSSRIPVDLFLVQPTDGFHADLRKELLYEEAMELAADGGSWAAAPSVVEPPQRINRAGDLLVAAGRYYRLQQDKVQRMLEPADEDSLPPLSRTGGLLGRVKEALNYFTDTPEAATDDETLSVHRCHGPWREAEVLRDLLIGEFAKADADGGSPLRQGDILILSPNPDVYAPILEAVLAQRDPDFHFTTAGVYGGKKSPIGALVRALLELPAGRVTSLDILNLLSLEAVRSALDWEDDELEMIEDWFRDAPFFWGLDEAHRRDVVNSGLHQNKIPAAAPSGIGDEKELMAVGTLDDFIKRLSLGTAYGGLILAIPDPVADETSSRRLPLRGVEGQQGLGLADQLLGALDALRSWVAFARPHPVHGPTEGHARPSMMSEWIAAFEAALEVLRPSGYLYADDLIELNRAMAALRRRAQAFGDKPIWLDLFASVVNEQCDFSAGAGQFMSGSVTLAPLKSSSIHPAKIIVFMGMNDGAFPPKAAKLGPEVYKDKFYEWDHKPCEPKPDQRAFSCRALESQEDSGMHAFLLALLAAEEKVIVTFDGYSGAEGAKAGAALPIEMLRRVAVDLTTSCKQDPRDHFRYRTHGLNAHSRAPENLLFEGPSPGHRVRNKDLSRKDKEAADPYTYDVVADGVGSSLAKDMHGVLVPILDDRLAKMGIADWIRFWTSPPRQCLRMLNIHVPYEEAVLPTEANMAIITPAVSQARDWIKSAKSEGAKLDGLWERAARHSGVFPVGDLGSQLFEFLSAEDTHGAIRMRTVVSRVLKVDNLEAARIRPMRSERFELYVHGEHLAVVSFEHYKEENACRWLCLLPELDGFIRDGKNSDEIAKALRVTPGRLSVMRQKRLTKVLFVGLEAPKAKTGSNGAMSVDSKIKHNVVELGFPCDGPDSDELRERYWQLARTALHKDRPALPKLLAKAMKARLMKMPLDTASESESDEYKEASQSALLSQKDIISRYGSDRNDPRARIFLPETYLFMDLHRLVGWGGDGEPEALVPRGATRLTAKKLGVANSNVDSGGGGADSDE